MIDWNTYVQSLIAWVRQLWHWIVVHSDTIRTWDIQALIRTAQTRVMQATPREQLIAAGALVAVILILVLRGLWVGRVYRDPVLARAALLADVSLLMTQLRGRARRPANVTYRSLKRRIARSRGAFDVPNADRLTAQWKQADREVSALLTTLRHRKKHVVRVEQYRHLSTLRDTLHAQVHAPTTKPLRP